MSVVVGIKENSASIQKVVLERQILEPRRTNGESCLSVSCLRNYFPCLFKPGGRLQPSGRASAAGVVLDISSRVHQAFPRMDLRNQPIVLLGDIGTCKGKLCPNIRHKIYQFNCLRETVEPPFVRFFRCFFDVCTGCLPLHAHAYPGFLWFKNEFKT